MRTIAIAAAACGLLMLGGCGIKGPLYLPQIPKPVAKAAPKPAEAKPAPVQTPAADHNKPASQDPAQ
jgi:predicted small lipoprotein YifL